MTNPNSRTRSPFNLRLCVLSFAFAVMAGTGASVAQVNNVASRSLFADPPRELLRPIELAREHLAEAEYPEAVQLLGDLLAESELDDYFLPTKRKIANKSIRKTAVRLLDGMPSRGRAVYELRYGIRAQKELEESLAMSDSRKRTDRLLQISRKYFPTRAGAAAILILGREALYRDDPGSAVRFLDRLIDSKQIRSLWDPHLSVLYAVAQYRCGRVEEAVQFLQEIQSEHSRVRVQVAGETRNLDLTDDAAIRGWLDTLQSPETASPVWSTEWRNFRGRDRQSEGTDGFPLSTPHWMLPVTDPNSLELVRELAVNFEPSSLARLPAANLLAVKNTVLVRTPYHLMGIDFETGKRTWTYPWTESRSNPDAERREADGTDEDSLDSLEQTTTLLRRKTWQDGIHGKMTSDGMRVFFVEQSPEVLDLDADNRNPSSVDLPTNTLVAVKILEATGQPVEGQLAWTRDGSQEQSDEWKNAFFLGPPAILNDTAYVLYELPGQIRVGALDSETGRTLWTQQVAATDDSQNWDQRRFRSLVGAMPSVHQGLLVCPTMVGGLVAIDLSDRSLAWGLKYTPMDAWDLLDFEYRDLPNWYDSGMIEFGNLLVVSPVDSDQYLAIDLNKGRIRRSWSRDDELFIAGRFGDRLVMIEGDALKLTPVTGYRVRKVKFNQYGTPVGLGFFAESRYYLPLTDNQLAVINLEKVEIEAVIPLSVQLGNLICYRGRILSQSAESVVSLYQKPYAKNLVESKPDVESPRVSLLKAELMEDAGKIDLAIESAGRLQQQLPNATGERLLTRLLTKKIGSGETIDWQEINRLQNLLESPIHQRRLLIARIEAEIKTRPAEQVVPLIADLMDLYSSADNDSNSLYGINSFESNLNRDERIAISDDIEIEHLRLMRSRLSSALASIPGARQETLLEGLRQRYENVVREGDPLKIRFAAELLGNFPFVRNSFASLVLEVENFTQRADLLWLESRLVHRWHQLVNSESTGTEAERIQTLVALTTVLRRLNPDPDGPGSTQLRACLNQLASRLAEISSEEQQRLLPPDFSLTQRQRKKPTDRIRQFPGRPPAQDGLTSIHVYSEYDDPDFHVAGDDQLFPAKLVHRLQLASDSLELKISDYGHFEIRDSYGRFLYTNSLQSRSTRHGHYVYDLRFSTYQLLGSILVLSSGYDHVAVDLNRIRSPDLPQSPGGFKRFGGGELDDREEAVLWRFDSRSLEAAPFQNENPTLFSEWSFPPPGVQSGLVRDKSGNRIGVTTQLSPDGFCILHGQYLGCIDPLTGTLLWHRSDIARKSDLVGDDQHVVVIAPDDQSYRVFSLVDGEEIVTGPQTRSAADDSPFAERLMNYGCTTVTYNSSTDGAELRAVDLSRATPHLVWKLKLSREATACRIGPEHIAVLEPSGQLSILDIRDGSQVQTRLPLEIKPARIEFVNQGGRWLFLVRDDQSLRENAILGAADHSEMQSFSPTERPFSGEIHALFPVDLLSGVQKNQTLSARGKLKLAWPGPARINGNTLLYQSLGADVPAILLTRPGEKTTELFFLRTSDGSLITFGHPIPFRNETSVVKLSEDLDSILFNSGYQWLELRMTDVSRPVEPPCRLGMDEDNVASNNELAKVLSRILFGSDLEIPSAEDFRDEESLIKDWVKREWKSNPLNPERSRIRR